MRHGGRAVVSDERQGQPPRRCAELFVVDRPELVRRQAVLLGAGAKRSLVVLAAMVVLLGTGAVPPAVAGLLAAGAIVVSGVLTIEQAYRSIAWTTGHPRRRNDPAPDRDDRHRGQKIADPVGGIGPHALLLGLVILTFAHS